MCVIVHKPNNVSLPIESLEKCFITNNDLCGYMVNIGYGILIQRGLKNIDDLIKQWESDTKHLKNNETVFHFRIATHGDINVSNSHPFPVTNDIRLLESSTVISNIGLAHNGILNTIPFDYYLDEEIFYKYSDTFLWISEVLSSVSNIQSMLSVLRILSIESHSKFSLMTGNKVHRIGTFYEIDDCYYSNTLWQYKPVKDKKYSYDYAAYNDWYYNKFVANDNFGEDICFQETENYNSESHDHTCYVCQGKFSINDLYEIIDETSSYYDRLICFDCYEYVYGDLNYGDKLYGDLK